MVYLDIYWEVCVQTDIKMVAQALELTQKLEKALEYDGATGMSLSDKIKSYQKYEEEEFCKRYLQGYEELDEEEGYIDGIYIDYLEYYYDDNEKLQNELSYKFREYKRDLIGGLYNDLRWVAHERNQLMHIPNYTIENYPKFVNVIQRALGYFQGSKKPNKWKQMVQRMTRPIYRFFSLLPNMIAIGLIILYGYTHQAGVIDLVGGFYHTTVAGLTDTHNTPFGWFLALFFPIVIVIFSIGIIFYVVQLISSFIELIFALVILFFTNTYYMIRVTIYFMIRYYGYILFFILSILLWNKDIDTIIGRLF